MIYCNCCKKETKFDIVESKVEISGKILIAEYIECKSCGFKILFSILDENLVNLRNKLNELQKTYNENLRECKEILSGESNKNYKDYNLNEISNKLRRAREEYKENFIVCFNKYKKYLT